MLVRDSGILQLFAESAQEVYDLMVMAPRIAEHPDVLLPVAICQDGFTITHSAEPVVLLDDETVQNFVGEYRIPSPLLAVRRPTTQGPFAMPDYHYEVRHQQVAAMAAALGVFEGVADEFAHASGRRYDVIEPYALDDADRAIVCLGSTGGTVKDVVDDLRGRGERVGLLEIRSFRPLPVERIRSALRFVPAVAVLDRADSPGGRPPLYADVGAALQATDVQLQSFVYGLGGRELHPEDIAGVYEHTLRDRLQPTYLGLRGTPCPA
jgi:pyruvate ferredoxin oxidoreductase alpha subunit